MGPARRSCICFASSGYSIASLDSAFVTLLPARCHKQQIPSYSQNRIWCWRSYCYASRWKTHYVLTKHVRLQTQEINVIRCQGCKTGWQGKGKMVRVRGVCTHNRLGWCKRWRAPKIRWACVKENLEFLRGCSNGDVTHIDHLQGQGVSGLVQIWLSYIPTLMPPSGCHISLEITF